MSEIHNINNDSKRVKAGMRWFGPEDEVSIQHIRQTPGITNIITALHHIPAGEIWTEAEVAKRKIEVEFIANDNEPDELSGVALYGWHKANSERTGLVWDTAESLVFTEDIKNGGPERDKHIENYKKSLKVLGMFDVENVVGNFMLVADWTRTGVEMLPDGSSSLKYSHEEFIAFDIFLLQRHQNINDYIIDGSYCQEEIDNARNYWETGLKHNSQQQQQLIKMITAGLPGAQEGFTLSDFRAAVAKYKGMGVGQLRSNIAYFLDQVVPVAQQAGVHLCCHADDPAFSPFLGTPRAVGCPDGYKFLLDHGCGVNLCVGSLLPNENNRDITALIYKVADYGQNAGMTINEIFPHIHLRPIETQGKNFREGHHAEHREELAQIVHALVDIGWHGVFRPDHAPTSAHGFGRPGYDVIGRGYGAQVLLGLFEMAEIIKATREKTVEAVINACNGRTELKTRALKAAIEAEIRQIREKTAFIKLPFAYGERDVCA